MRCREKFVQGNDDQKITIKADNSVSTKETQINRKKNKPPFSHNIAKIQLKTKIRNRKKSNRERIYDIKDTILMQ